LPQTRVPKYISGYGKSYALLTSETANTAVIFVHGLGGRPTGTWINFHGLVDEYSTEYPWWATCDLFFYGYESLHTPIRRNAALLAGFVESVWHSEWQEPNLPANNREYRDLIFAGHSEGGVLIRRLILDRYDSIKFSIKTNNPGANSDEIRLAMKQALSSDFVMASYLRLFAPACRGTNFSSWVGFLSSFSLFVSAMAASVLVRNELLPESPVLKTLQRGTEKAHAEFSEIRSLFTRPLFGVPDQIVFSESYQGEEPFWDVGHDHFSVCKPDYLHKRPLEFVSK
jgi:hypothetical protein